MKKYAVIGGGPAGAVAAETLRKLDEESEMTVVTDERYPFYRREHIAGLISGDETEEGLFEKGKDFYERIDARLVTGRVIGVFTGKNQLALSDGSRIGYDSLLIASGAKPVLLHSQGAELEGVSTLYTLDVVKKVSNLVTQANKVLVVGGGTVAMKLVPMLRRIGLNVWLIEKADRLWPAMFDKKASEIVENRLKHEGVEVLLNEEVIELKGGYGKIESVSLKSQRTLPCDLLLLTMGIQPNIDFLNGSGIEVDLGVVVDRHLRTNIANIYAAGDVAQVPDPLYEAPVLHPTWAYAEEQGEIAAYNMAGLEREYQGAVPLFSLSLYGIGIVTAGITQPQANFQELSRFSPYEGLYRKFVLRGNRLVGAILIGKGLDRKLLKPRVKKVLLNMADVGTTKADLLKEDFDFGLLVKQAENSLTPSSV